MLGLADLWAMNPNDRQNEPVPSSARHDTFEWEDFPHASLTKTIIGGMFEVYNTLGAGFLEAVYANALTVELRKRGLQVDRDVAFDVPYGGVVVGRYVADLVVEHKVIVETKVAKAIDPAHRRQTLNYLKASGLNVGLVLNFGPSVQFKRVVLTSHRSRRRGLIEDGNSNS
jgi:GxxExxY protein